MIRELRVLGSVYDGAERSLVKQLAPNVIEQLLGLAQASQTINARKETANE
jgi:hypothetical protein